MVRTNYRNKFKRYYGINFSSDYVVHHIDLDRENNDINNLMLLPKKLHAKYHMCLTAAKRGIPIYKTTQIVFDAKITGNNFGRSYETQMIVNLLDAIKECNIWYDYKLYLDGIIPNIHGIYLDKERER